MATISKAFARIHSLPPATRMPRYAPVGTPSTRTIREPQARMADRMAEPRNAAFFALPKEPEDARITGGTRSLDRRLLALNLRDSRIRRESSSFSLSLAS
jgi:hypothetical protein